MNSNNLKKIVIKDFLVITFPHFLSEYSLGLPKKKRQHLFKSFIFAFVISPLRTNEKNGAVVSHLFLWPFFFKKKKSTIPLAHWQAPSPTQKNTLKPEWNETFELPVGAPKPMLHVRQIFAEGAPCPQFLLSSTSLHPHLFSKKKTWRSSKDLVLRC